MSVLGAATLSSTFGANHRADCPACGGTMSVIRRSPHATLSKTEVQTLSCNACDAEETRTVNRDGEAV